MSHIKDIVRSVSEDIWGKGRLDLIDEYFAKDFVNHDPEEGFGEDRNGYRASVQAVRSGLSDVECETTHVVVEDDLAATRWIIRGVHAAELFGLPPTHETIEVSGTGIARFRDGKIVEEWNEMDTLGLMQQLGAIPETA